MFFPLRLDDKFDNTYNNACLISCIVYQFAFNYWGVDACFLCCPNSNCSTVNTDCALFLFWTTDSVWNSKKRRKSRNQNKQIGILLSQNQSVVLGWTIEMTVHQTLTALIHTHTHTHLALRCILCLLLFFQSFSSYFLELYSNNPIVQQICELRLP